MALSTGTKAPEFTLKTKTAEGLLTSHSRTTSASRRPFCSSSPRIYQRLLKEMCDVSAGLSAYTELNAAVYGISVDSPFALEKMAAVDSLQFPLLSDFNKEVSDAYDVLYPDLLGFKGVSKRSAFVIDETGTIIYAESSDDPHDLPDFDAIKAVLKG